MATMGLPKSSSPMPVARQRARAPAALRPWVVTRERRAGIRPPYARLRQPSASMLACGTGRKGGMAMAEFTGKVAIVTGAGSGIGEACARLLASRGAQVLVADVAA